MDTQAHNKHTHTHLLNPPSLLLSSCTPLKVLFKKKDTHIQTEPLQKSDVACTARRDVRSQKALCDFYFFYVGRLLTLRNNV